MKKNSLEYTYNPILNSQFIVNVNIYIKKSDQNGIKTGRENKKKEQYDENYFFWYGFFSCMSVMFCPPRSID